MGAVGVLTEGMVTFLNALTFKGLNLKLICPNFKLICSNLELILMNFKLIWLNFKLISSN